MLGDRAGAWGAASTGWTPRWGWCHERWRPARATARARDPDGNLRASGGHWRQTGRRIGTSSTVLKRVPSLE